jgi:glycosyltransferase involved in cell wall biosynthesis
VIGLFRGLHWIATAPKEVEEIRALFGASAKIELIPPPFPEPYPHSSAPKVKGKLRLIFFARLSAMKNIGFLLNVLPKIRGEIEFDIYGPVDPDYESTWNEIFVHLRNFSKQGISANYKGPIPSSQSLDTLSRYDLFVQPSLSENFGFSIVEALAAGTPVLISDRTPWNEINEIGIGGAHSLDHAETWVQTLQSYVDLDHESWAKISERATNWVESKDASGKELHSIYAKA